MSKKTIRALISAVAIGGTLAALLVVTMRGSTQYYKTVDEVMPTAAEWYGKGLQIHGYVVPGSIGRRGSTLEHRFEVENGGSVVTAGYTGILPDTFTDGSEVVLKGQLSEAGFAVEPNGVMAKCPSKYEPGSPDYSAEGVVP